MEARKCLSQLGMIDPNQIKLAIDELTWLQMAWQMNPQQRFGIH